MEILSRHIEIDEESGIVGVKDVIDICIVGGDKDLGSLRIVQFEDGYVSADLSKVDVYSDAESFCRSRYPHRSRMDIMVHILGDSDKSPKKARIVRRCNLKASQLNLYRDYLVENEFLKALRREDGVEIFETTAKGREFLRKYRKIKSVLEKNMI